MTWGWAALWYDRSGNPIGVDEYARLYADPQYQRLQSTEYGGVRVSTIWLGCNLGFNEKMQALIFETMVFGGPHDKRQWRYATEQEAQDGHVAACGLVFSELPIGE